jgi:hypothetical protein
MPDQADNKVMLNRRTRAAGRAGSGPVVSQAASNLDSGAAAMRAGIIAQA